MFIYSYEWNGDVKRNIWFLFSRTSLCKTWILFMCISIFVDVTYLLSKLSGDSRWILRFSDLWLCSKSRGTGEMAEYCGVPEDAITEASVSNWSDE